MPIVTRSIGTPLTFGDVGGGPQLVQQRIGHVVGLGDEPAQPGRGQHAPPLRRRVSRVGPPVGQLRQHLLGGAADQRQPVAAVAPGPFGGVPFGDQRVRGRGGGGPMAGQRGDRALPAKTAIGSEKVP